MRANDQSGAAPEPPSDHGIVTRRVSPADIADVLVLGCRDLMAAPVASFVIASIYTLGGWLLAALLLVLRLPYLVYPLAMGFALIAPFVAVAFYEVSRRLEAGQQASVAAIWQATCGSIRRDVRWMALITAFAFFIWMDIAAMLTLSFFGAKALDMAVLLKEIVSTGQGLAFLAVGHIVGAVIAALIFSISVISFPLLYDRDVDIITGIATSVRFVRENPLAMALWCMIIAASIVASIAAGLALLPFALPVLGYATWHLYRRAVV